jgi:hypothetical protein
MPGQAQEKDGRRRRGQKEIKGRSTHVRRITSNVIHTRARDRDEIEIEVAYDVRSSRSTTMRIEPCDSFGVLHSLSYSALQLRSRPNVLLRLMRMTAERC